jgi:hypothetical protein
MELGRSQSMPLIQFQMELMSLTTVVGERPLSISPVSSTTTLERIRNLKVRADLEHCTRSKQERNLTYRRCSTKETFDLCLTVCALADCALADCALADCALADCADWL